MDFNPYFNPVGLDFDILKKLSNFKTRFADIQIHTANSPIAEVRNTHIALLGVPEERSSSNIGCAFAPDKIREKFYALYKPSNKLNIIDLGNFKTSGTLTDTYLGLRDVLIELLEMNVVPVILGGNSDLAYSVYLAYEKLDKTINIVDVNSKIDIGNDESFDFQSYLGKIVLHKATNLFNFTNIGYQTYFVCQDDIDLMQKLLFDFYRLGAVRSNLKECEPILRDADFVSFNISAVKQSDAPANANASPNGLSGEEACQLAKYAGFSDRTSSFGIFEINPMFDKNSQTEHLAAQMIWYFIEGFSQRKQDYPFSSIDFCTKFIVNMSNINHDVIFYKSKKTERWWLEVPYKNSKTERNIVVACSYEDYQKACNQEIPERWWKTFQKIN